MLRIQSDTDLLGIDKEKTFTASAIVKPAELLARVVNVLGGFDQPIQRAQGINLFDDDHILANEKPPMFSIGNDIISGSPKRNRAMSVAVPNYRKESVSKGEHDYTWTNGESAEKFRREANLRSGKISLPAKIEDSPQNMLSRLFFKKQSSTENPAEYLKSTMKGRVSAQNGTENVRDTAKPRRGSIFPTFGFGSDDKSDAEVYKEKTKSGRHSIFPTFDFNEREDEEAMAKAYMEKTKRGRHSIFPTFDFSEDEDTEAIKAYQQKAKRHSIFPTFDFSEDEDEAKAYRERTKSGRRSIFPTFDFSDLDDEGEKYKQSTKHGRRSIFPSFNFSGHSNDDDTVDEDEVRKYQNRTKKGRLSLFPTFGKSKKHDDDEVLPESSDELVDYKNKTKRGRSSLFPSFGKERKNSSPTNSAVGDLEASIRQFNRTKRGRNSADDLESYRNATQNGRGSFSSELENYRNKTSRGRPSLFDPDINISALPESEQVEVLEHTSVADLLRALAVLETATGPDDTEPPGLMDLIRPTGRRGSIRPDFSIPTSPKEEETPGPRRRRISVRAAAPQFTPTLATVVAGAELQITATAARENRMSMLTQPPPPYTETETEEPKPRQRRYSPAPNDNRPSTGPVPRYFSKMRKESANNSNIEEGDSRRNSLTDVVIDSMKDNT